MDLNESTQIISTTYSVCAMRPNQSQTRAANAFQNKREWNGRMKMKKKCAQKSILNGCYIWANAHPNWPKRFDRQINYQPKYAHHLYETMLIFMRLQTVTDNAMHWPIETSVQRRKELFKRMEMTENEKEQNTSFRYDGMVAMKMQSRHNSWTYYA